MSDLFNQSILPFTADHVDIICSEGIFAAVRFLMELSGKDFKLKDKYSMYLAGSLTEYGDKGAGWRRDIIRRYGKEYLFLNPEDHAVSLMRLRRDGDIDYAKYAQATSVCDKANIVLADAVLANCEVDTKNPDKDSPSYGTGMGLYFAHLINRPVVAFYPRDPKDISALMYNIVTEKGFYTPDNHLSALQYLSALLGHDEVKVSVDDSGRRFNISRHWIDKYIASYSALKDAIPDAVLVSLARSIHRDILDRYPSKYYDDSRIIPHEKLTQLINDGIISYLYLIGCRDMAYSRFQLLKNEYAGITECCEIERMMRILVKTVLCNALGKNWYSNAVPGGVKMQCNKKNTDYIAKNPFLATGDNQRNDYEFIDVGGIMEIFKYDDNWEHFTKIFGKYENAEKHIRHYKTMRDFESHNIDNITETDIYYGKGAIKWILECLRQQADLKITI
jgi:hypothetical protein